MGKLIVVEGTDCSGKETQTRLLVDRFEKENIKVKRLSFPMYDTPTGQIIGACLLGKPDMVNNLLKTDGGFFPEGGGNIDALAAIDFYAADRRYNLPKIIDALENNDIVLIDRYVTSNMAHRGGLIDNKEERLKMYEKIELKEYVINELPRPDMVILLYLPYEYACILKKNRKELPDEAEQNISYLKKGENAYLELSELYNYDIVTCIKDNEIRTINDINDEVYSKVKKLIKK